MDILLSIGYLYFYLSIHAVDIHVYTDRYAFIAVCVLVRIMKGQGVGPRAIQQTGR